MRGCTITSTLLATATLPLRLEKRAVLLSKQGVGGDVDGGRVPALTVVKYGTRNDIIVANQETVPRFVIEPT